MNQNISKPPDQPHSALLAPCSPTERWADALLHGLAIVLAVGALVWLLDRTGDIAEMRLPLAVYGAGLLTMLVASAAYNLFDGRGKAFRRRLDHAAIFLMIAGTYTPFAWLRVPPPTDDILGIGIWSGAALGIMGKLTLPHAPRVLAVTIYLAMGWSVVFVLDPLIDVLRPETLILIVAGGMLYTIGVPIHLMHRLKYHDAIWHGFVIAGSACHFVAIAVEFAP